MIVDLRGKHNRVRSIPIPAWLKASIDRWTEAAGITEGRLFRSINRGGRITSETMSDQAIYAVLIQCANELGFKCLAPHDARRTWAKLCKKGGSDLQQIQLSMGHASIQTTERYLGTTQDLTDSPADRLHLRPKVQ